MPLQIHPTAIIDTSSNLAEDVKIGAFATVGPRCQIGAGTIIHSGVHIVCDTTVGKNCVIHSCAVLGGDPQDLKYKGERTQLIIGDSTQIHEYATLNRGTAGGGSVTRVGDSCLIMAYVHIAHDCIIGNGCVLTNGAQLAGHVVVEDYAILSGGVLIHHYVTLGTLCFIAPKSLVRTDIPPFVIADGEPARPRKLNNEGLRRHRYSREVVNALQKAFRYFHRDGVTQTEALELIAQDPIAEIPEVENLITHIKNTLNGFLGRSLEASRADRIENNGVHPSNSSDK